MFLIHKNTLALEEQLIVACMVTHKNVDSAETLI